MMYKIKNNKGMFSTGGMWPRFTKYGKVWQSIGHLKGHFTMLREYSESGRSGGPRWDRCVWPYDNCLVVEVETKNEYTIEELLDETKKSNV